METLVKIKVSSEEGHTEYNLVPSEALAKINELYDNGKRWIYIDGSNVSPSRLTEASLAGAKSVVMMNAVVGGSSEDYLCGGCQNFDDCESDVKDEYLAALEDEATVSVDPKAYQDPDDYDFVSQNKLSADFELDIHKFRNHRGEITIDSDSKEASMIVVLEFTPANGVHNNKLKVHVDQDHIPEILHMRGLLFEGAKKQLDDYAEDQLKKFRKTFNV